MESQRPRAVLAASSSRASTTGVRVEPRGARAPREDARLRGRGARDAGAAELERRGGARRGQAAGARRAHRRHRPDRHARRRSARTRRGSRREARQTRRRARATTRGRRDGEDADEPKVDARRRRPRHLAEPGAQPRARDRHEVLDRTGVIIEIFHRHAQEPRGAPAGRDRAARVHRAAPARSRRAARSASTGRGAGEAALELDRRQGPRPHRRAARASSRRSSANRTCAARSAREAPTRRARRLHQRRQVVADARAHRQRGATSRTSCSPRSTPPCARSSPRAQAAHPGQRHRRLHQEAAARSGRELQVARSTRRSRRRSSCTSSTPPIPTWEASSRSRARCSREIGAGEVPTLLVMNKIDKLSPAQLERAPRAPPRRLVRLRPRPAAVARAARAAHRVLRGELRRGRIPGAVRSAAAGLGRCTKAGACSKSATRSTASRAPAQRRRNHRAG